MQYGASTCLNLLKSLQIKGPLAIMNHYKIKKDRDANDETTETSTRPKSYTHHEAAVVRSTFSCSQMLGDKPIHQPCNISDQQNACIQPVSKTSPSEYQSHKQRRAQNMFPMESSQQSSTTQMLTTERQRKLQNYDRNRTMNEREKFLVFIKILLRILNRVESDDDTDKHLLLRLQAKSIIRQCIRQNRIGDGEYQPMIGAIECRLRPSVGEHTWNMALIYSRRYLKRYETWLRTRICDQQQKFRSSVIATAV
jgi:hypothetical protein